MARLVNCSGWRALYVEGSHDIRTWNLISGNTSLTYQTQIPITLSTSGSSRLQLDGRQIIWATFQGFSETATVHEITLPRLAP
jgi:hypothetical protein